MGCRELTYLVVIGYLGDSDGNGIEHERGALLEEGSVLKILGRGTHIFCKQVGQRGKSLEEELDVLESLRGDGGYGSVDKTVEFFAGRERQLDVALIDALLHPASAVFEGYCGARAVLHFKADGDGFGVGEHCARLRNYLAEILQSSQDSIKVNVRHCFLISQPSFLLFNIDKNIQSRCPAPVILLHCILPHSMPQSQLHTGDTAKNSQNRLIFSGFYTYFFGVFR